MRHTTALLALVSLALAPIAAAQPAAAREMPKDSFNWELSFEPGVWYASPLGSVRLPGTPTFVGTRKISEFNLDSPRLAPFGELNYRILDGSSNPVWRVTASAAAISLDDRGDTAETTEFIGPLTLSPGDRLRASFDLFTAELLAARSIELPDNLAGKPGDTIRTRLELGGGFRLTTLDFRIEGPTGAAAKARETLVDPVVTAKLAMDIAQDFTIDLQLSAGAWPFGDRDSFAGDVVAGFQYRPTDNVGVQIGYRYFVTTVESGSGVDQFKYTGGLAGLYGTVVLRF